MTSNSRAPRAVVFAVLFCVVSAAALAQAGAPKSGQSASVQAASSAATSTPSPDTSKYVGAETCKTCHEEIYNAWEKTPHWKTTLNTKGGPPQWEWIFA